MWPTRHQIKMSQPQAHCWPALSHILQSRHHIQNHNSLSCFYFADPAGHAPSYLLLPAHLFYGYLPHRLSPRYGHTHQRPEFWES